MSVGILLAVGAVLAQEGTVAMPGGGDFYLIQPGDTLWDISTRFLNDPQAWPELWSYNEYITNPHWIYPGNRIYFQLGDRLNPPSVGVDAPRSDGYTPPAPMVATAAPVCDFPPRFDQSFDDLALSAEGVLSTEDDLGLRGKVYAADEPGELLAETSYVYLRMDDDDGVECGDELSIYRKVRSKVKADGATLGDLYRVLATVEVVRVDDDIVTAKIRDSYAELERGDLVGAPTDVELVVDVRPPEGDLRASIVARLHAEQRLASTYETVFLDRGLNDGLDVGTSLYIVEQRDGAVIEGAEDELLPERVVGRVVIVRSSEDHATGVVVNAARDIEVGLRLATRPNGE